jgi:hypothetical protein
VGPFSDRLAQLVSGERDPSAPLPTYVTSSTANAANGPLSGLRCSSSTPSAPTAAAGGHRVADIGELERAESALMADESWVALIDRVGSSYAEGAQQAIYRRIT